MTIDIGKIFIDAKTGAGRLYLPKTIIESAGLEHKDQLKIETTKNQIITTPIKKI